LIPTIRTKIAKVHNFKTKTNRAISLTFVGSHLTTLLLCLALAIALGTNGSSASAAQDASDLFKSAQERFAGQDFKGAAGELEKLVAREPNNAQGHNLLGQTYHRMGRLDLARSNYEKAASLAPELPEPRYNLAMLLLDQGDAANARRILLELLKGTNNPEYIHDLGVIDEKLGQIQEAEQCYVKACQMMPNSSQFHYSLARRLYLDHQVEQSISEYQKALAIDPDNIDAHNNLGVALADLGQYPEAIEQYQAALKINGNYPEAQQNLGYAQAHTSLGITYFKQGNSEKAIAEYKKALEIDANFGDAYYNLGLLYQAKGAIEQSVQAYEAAIRCNPNNAKAHNNLGVAYHKLGKNDRAQNEYKEALRLKPDLAEAQQNLQDLK
jgi:tetratricopeptide (TPR) repeat protein